MSAPGPLSCLLCSRTFRSPWSKDQHEMQHDRLRHTCASCGWMYRDYSNYLRHKDDCLVANTVAACLSFTEDSDYGTMKGNFGLERRKESQGNGKTEQLTAPNPTKAQSMVATGTTHDKETDQVDRILATPSGSNSWGLVGGAPTLTQQLSSGELNDETNFSSSHARIDYSRNDEMVRPYDPQLEGHRRNGQEDMDGNEVFDASTRKKMESSVGSQKIINQKRFLHHTKTAHQIVNEAESEDEDQMKIDSEEEDEMGEKQKKGVQQTGCNRAKKLHCEFCHRRFKTMSKYAMHISDHEEKLLRYECPSCRHRFRVWFDFYQHEFHNHGRKVLKKNQHLYFITYEESSNGSEQRPKQSKINGQALGSEQLQHWSGKTRQSTMKEPFAAPTPYKKPLGFSFAPAPQYGYDPNITFDLPDEEFKKPRSPTAESTNGGEGEIKLRISRVKEKPTDTLTVKDSASRPLWQAQLTTPPSSPGETRDTTVCAMCNFEYGEKDDTWFDDAWLECPGCKLYCHETCMHNHRKICNALLTPSIAPTKSYTSATNGSGDRSATLPEKVSPSRPVSSSKRNYDTVSVEYSNESSNKNAPSLQPTQERDPSSDESFILDHPIGPRSPVQAGRTRSPAPLHHPRGLLKGVSNFVTSKPLQRVDSPILGKMPSTPISGSFVASSSPPTTPAKRRRVDVVDDDDDTQPASNLNTDEHCCLLAVKDAFQNLQLQGRLMAQQEVLRVLCNVVYDRVTPSALMPNIDPQRPTPVDHAKAHKGSAREAETFCERDVFPALRKLNRQWRKHAVLKIQHVLYNVQYEYCFKYGNN